MFHTHFNRTGNDKNEGDEDNHEICCIKQTTAIVQRTPYYAALVGVHSGVTPSTVYSIMNSKGEDVSIITVKRLCDGLNITLKEFFNDSDFQ